LENGKDSFGEETDNNTKKNSQVKFPSRIRNLETNEMGWKYETRELNDDNDMQNYKEYTLRKRNSESTKGSDGNSSEKNSSQINGDTEYKKNLEKAKEEYGEELKNLEKKGLRLKQEKIYIRKKIAKNYGVDEADLKENVKFKEPLKESLKEPLKEPLNRTIERTIE
jgi:hypothetical protein